MMANVTREEEKRIREWQKRTPDRRPYQPTIEERIRQNEAEISANLAKLRRMREKGK